MPLLKVFLSTVPTIALVSYCLLFLFFSISQKDRFIRMFMLVLVPLIIWTASAVFFAIELYPGAFFWNRIMIAGMLAVPFVVYCFVSVFTDSLRICSTFIWGCLTTTAVIFALLGLVVSDANVVTHMVSINGIQFKTYEFVYSLGTMSTPIYLFMFIIIAAILIKASKTIHNGKTTFERISLIMVGVMIMFIGSLTNMFDSLGKYPLDVLACLINAILITVAIFKYRMLEFRFMITRGLVYSFFAILLTISYVFSVFFIEKHIGSEYRSIVPYFTTLTALLIASIFQPLFRLTNRLVDKMFYQAEYSKRQALRNFSAVISNNLDLNSIAGELIDAVQLAFRPKQVMILTKYEEKSLYYVFRTSSQLYQPDFELAYDHPIVEWFKSKHPSLLREELYTSPFLKSMWEQEKKKIYDLDIELIIPIRSRNDIVGMLTLTRKSNNTAYTLDDLDLLTYLGASTSIAFDNARLYTRSQTEAITDSLTKLYNHRYFFKALSEQVDKIGSAELSLLLIDLDLFKLYNDLYGHFEGDKALAVVASIMRRIVGDRGIVCRYGGEEFTVLLPYYDPKMAFDLAERIRLEIENNFLNSNDVTQRFLTASIGICTYPHAAPNSEELLKRADLAMYTAKNQGKNQTVIYSPRVITAEMSTKFSSADILSKPSYTATIYALTAAIDAKDHYTFGHSQRVAEYSTLLASELNLDNSHIEILREAALLHDIGKLGVPENLLTKAGKLSNDEFDIVKKHVEMSITIIKHLPSLNHVIPAIIGHHERWDGKGYPRGLKGENIPLLARCLAITDAFDAMTSNRPYRVGLTVSAAVNEIKNSTGTQFDPVMADLFIKLVLDGTIKVDKRGEIKNII